MKLDVVIESLPILYVIGEAIGRLENDRDIANGLALTGPELDAIEHSERDAQRVLMWMLYG